MFAVTGAGSTIVRELALLTGETVHRIQATLSYPGTAYVLPRAPRYVFAAGLLYGMRIRDMSPEGMMACCSVNLINTLRLCEHVLDTDVSARICVVGSESAEHGSFDRLYAATKAGVHAYVRTRTVGPQQQLVCVSPTIIEDSGMTRRRHDYPEVLQRRKTVRAIDVARAIHEVLWAEDRTLNNRVIHVTERRPP